MEKLSKIAKRLDTFFKILFWVLLVAVGIVVLYAVMKFIVLTQEGMPEHTVSEQFVLGNIKLDISKEAMPAIGETWRTYVLPCLAFVISVIVAILGIRIVRSILKPMISGSPFIGSVSVDLKKLGYLALFGGAAVTVCNAIGDMLFFKLFYDVSSSILKDSVTGITYTQTLDFTFVIIAVILFLASYAFRYGEELQQLADETL